MGTNKRHEGEMTKEGKTKSAAKSKGAIQKKPSSKAPAASSRPKSGKASASASKSSKSSKSSKPASAAPKGDKKSAPAKKKAAAAKKVPGALKRKERMDEPVDADDDTEARVVSEGPDHDEDDTGGNVSDDEENVKAKRSRAAKGPDTRTPKEKKADEDRARKRTNAKSKRRGYRVVADRGGYSSNPAYTTPDGSFDVAVPITTPGEAIRACKWAPTQPDKAAFGGLTEFEERSALALESLPKSAARVLQAHGEQYLRRLTAEAMQLMVDQCKTKVMPAMVASVTRKLEGVQKYSFVAPHGLVRYSQEEAGGLRTEKFGGEIDDIEGEGVLLEMQEEMKAHLHKRAKLVKDGALVKPSDSHYDEKLKEAYDSVANDISDLRERAAEVGFA